jgi:hypothetical protein
MDVGVIEFIGAPEFKGLNIGFVLDEGLQTEDPLKMSVFNTERSLHCKHWDLLPNILFMLRLSKVYVWML